jgi:hypothetical protein
MIVGHVIDAKIGAQKQGASWMFVRRVGGSYLE